MSSLFVSEKAPPTPLAAFVTLRWKGELYAARHVGEGEHAELGDGPDALAPLDDLGDCCVATTTRGVPTALVPAGLRARLDGPGAPTRILLGPAVVPLALGERVELRVGPFVVRVEGSLREGLPRRAPRPLPTRVLLAGAALLQAAFLVGGTLASEPLEVGDPEADTRALRSLWLASAEHHEEVSAEAQLGSEPSPPDAATVQEEPLACLGEAVVMSPSVESEGRGDGVLAAFGGGLTVLAAGLGFVALRRREKAPA